MGAALVARSAGLDLTFAASLRAIIPRARLSLRGYFAVTHSYVGWKVLGLLCPFIPGLLIRSSRVIRHPSIGDITVDSEDEKHRSSQRSTDLYLPLMGSITYILIYGLSKGAVDDFHPDVFGRRATLAASLVCLEVALMKLLYYLAGTSSSPSLSLPDLVAYSGYKFVSLVPILAIGLMFADANFNLFRASFFYFSCAAAFATFVSLRRASEDNKVDDCWASTSSGASHHQGLRLLPRYISVAFGIFQFLQCWLLTPTFARAVPTAST
eukprot:GHVU01216908.1.p1 GENE.GHVU01216908.1~~GHVU01216908.1.p1  ORF type:complete len:289 (+),score=54.18 GHVU01216908.1:65-868(+)